MLKCYRQQLLIKNYHKNILSERSCYNVSISSLLFKILLFAVLIVFLYLFYYYGKDKYGRQKYICRKFVYLYFYFYVKLTKLFLQYVIFTKIYNIFKIIYLFIPTIVFYYNIVIYLCIP